jgi:hypothetical protein
LRCIKSIVLAKNSIGQLPRLQAQFTTDTSLLGIITAIACTFTDDHKIDESALRKHAAWLATQLGTVASELEGKLPVGISKFVAALRCRVNYLEANYENS